jgi:signal transduction histidine kinase
MQELFDDVASQLGESSRAKGVAMSFAIAPDVPPQLVGDALRLEQILINFAGNAIKFTARGTIAVSVRLLSGTATGVTLHFEVQDTGIGLSDAQMGRLFQTFQQADGSTTRNFGGTGLGLAICRKLAGLMGGEVGVRSVAGNGQVALDRLAGGRYDLVLMDLQMPLMDGITAAAAIRARHEHRLLPIVALTANATPQDRQRCLDAGMNDFLAKPVDAKLLWALLRKWLLPASPPAW